MAFAVPAGAYDRFMGRYSRPLAPLFADFAGVPADARVLDVGCGPGALTAELAGRLGAEQVAAVDPAEAFVAACRERVPGASVAQAAAEQLPFADRGFDAALSQLAVTFMQDAEAGVGEMRRVVRAGGTVAACMWAPGEQMQLIHLFWRAASIFGSAGGTEDLRMRYRRRDELEGLLERAGLEAVETELLEVESPYESFDELWESLGTAAGPVHRFVASLDDERRDAMRAELHRLLGEPAGGLALSASAWAVRGRVPG